MFVSGFAAAWVSILIASLSCALQHLRNFASECCSPCNGSDTHADRCWRGLDHGRRDGFLYATRKDLLHIGEAKPADSKGVVIVGSLIALILAILSPLASSHPDGLEWVAEEHGFIDAAKDAFYNIIPDYTMPGISNPAIATIIAGIVGSIVVFVIACHWSRRKTRSRPRGSEVNACESFTRIGIVYPSTQRKGEGPFTFAFIIFEPDTPRLVVGVSSLPDSGACAGLSSRVGLGLVLKRSLLLFSLFWLPSHWFSPGSTHRTLVLPVVCE